MSNSPKVLIVIPARGGSKGIPRKNLRPLNRKPLIYYSIATSIASKHAPDVYVSTDDQEIASTAKHYGANVINRPPEISDDQTTLDPVVIDTVERLQTLEKKKYDIVVTAQPTSPLLKTETLDKAIDKLIQNSSLDTIISATNDTHLTWSQDANGEYTPKYEKRVNRQYLPVTLRETGGFLISRTVNLENGSRIGISVSLQELTGGEAIDIDTYDDWNLCEYHLSRKRVLFVVSGYKEIGLGHVYNSLIIANDILNHEVRFLVDHKSELARDKIKEQNYQVHSQQSDNILDDIFALAPDIVINDILDTSSRYITDLKDKGIKVINFEDLGEGAKYADLVINAIYPEKEVLPNHYFGHNYFVLRDEFFRTNPKGPNDHIKNVLLTFGGVDPNNLTHKVLNAISSFCAENAINISIVVGPGYAWDYTLKSHYGIDLNKNCSNIAEHMNNADVIFTSAGRTTYEVASLQKPTIVLAQNERELTHFFASPEYGFINLGLGTKTDEVEILKTFINLTKTPQSRAHMIKLMRSTDLKSGRSRVQQLIKKVIET